MQYIRVGSVVMLLHDTSDIFLESTEPSKYVRYKRTWYCRYMRVGSVVMLLHDPSDIFLESAKLFKYVGAETASVAGFVGLLLSWFLCRLVFLPLWVIRSTG